MTLHIRGWEWLPLHMVAYESNGWLPPYLVYLGFFLALPLSWVLGCLAIPSDCGLIGSDTSLIIMILWVVLLAWTLPTMQVLVDNIPWPQSTIQVSVAARWPWSDGLAGGQMVNLRRGWSSFLSEYALELGGWSGCVEIANLSGGSSGGGGFSHLLATHSSCVGALLLLATVNAIQE